APSPSSLQAACAAHRSALLAWQRAYAFRNGPLMESSAYLRSAFWPIRPAAVREVLEGREAIDGEFVDSLGGDVKGMFALEHLLYEGPEEHGAVWLARPDQARALALGVAYADDALGHAKRASQLLGTGDEFAERFVRGGQDSINVLVNQIVGTVDTA